jgi:hypothetical protein
MLSCKALQEVCDSGRCRRVRASERDVRPVANQAEPNTSVSNVLLTPATQHHPPSPPHHIPSHHINISVSFISAQHHSSHFIFSSYHLAYPHPQLLASSNQPPPQSTPVTPASAQPECQTTAHTTAQPPPQTAAPPPPRTRQTHAPSSSPAPPAQTTAPRPASPTPSRKSTSAAC